MRIAYLDCFSGISGDMFMGALVDAGVSRELLQDVVNRLGIGAALRFSTVNRSGITATKVDVLVDGVKAEAGEHHHDHHEPGQDHNHGDGEHSHGHETKPVELREHNYVLEASSSRTRSERDNGKHAHGGANETPLDRPKAAAHDHGRGLVEIRKIIQASGLSQAAKANAVGIFEALGAAEAKIHNMPVDKVHFHEVGAVDALVDIICAAVGAEALGASEIICSPLNVGGGTVNCAHGVFPVPAPATLELLRGVPVFSSGIQAELVTPTGAAIVKRLATRFIPFPAMHVERVGYGAGSKDFSGHANVVRLTLGLAEKSLAVAEVSQDTITVLEANLDDMNPQVFGYVMDRLFEQGALDVYGVPVQMKKNRPGMVLTVLCRADEVRALQEIIFAETTTLGIRRREERRETLSRKWIAVSTPWGEVRLKVASLHGEVTNYAPEYEDCRRIAAEHHVPLKTVMQEVVQGYLKTLA